MDSSFEKVPIVLYDTKFLQLKKTTAPNGAGEWVYAHRPNAKNVVVILPVLHDNEQGDKIIFLEEIRPPLIAENKAVTIISLPAGLVGDDLPDETTENAITRELLEETGYKADSVKVVNKNVASSSGLTDETFDIGIADINGDELFSAPKTDGGVILKQHKVFVGDVFVWLKQQESEGKAISSQALAALFIYFCTNI